MQIYIPVKEIHGAHISLNRLFSFNECRVFLCIGARGYGKTFASKRKCFKDFKFKNKRFIVARDTTAACDELCKDNGEKFLNDIASIQNFSNDKIEVKGQTIYFNDKIAGEIMPLSTYYKYKGNKYDIGWLLFDEFIEEDCQAYRGNRARQFVNTLQTTIRDKDSARIICTANALDMGNEILELLDFHIKNGQYGYYLNKEKKSVLYYAPNSPEFEKRQENSISSVIAKGTFLDASMNKNEFESNGCVIFEKRKPCDIWGIYYNLENECFRLYQAKDGSTFYVCKDINSNSYSYMRYVFTAKQAKMDRILADSKIRQWLKKLLATKQVQFESQYLFGVYCSIVENTLKK